MAWHNFVSLNWKLKYKLVQLGLTQHSLKCHWKSLIHSPARPLVHSENTFSFYVRPLLPSLWPPPGAAPSCYPLVDCRGCYTLCLIRNAISGNRCRIFVIHVSKHYNQHSICLFSTELAAEKQDTQNLAKSFCMARRCN